MHDEVSELIWNLNDIQDQWETSVENINKAILQKALKLGIIKELKFKFQEFDIQDMFEYHDGKICLDCRRNLKCDQHKLQKKEKLIDDSDF